MINKIVYQQSPYTITLKKNHGLPIEWIVSNGTYSFSIGEEPVFDSRSLDVLMAEWLDLRMSELQGAPEKHVVEEQ